MTKCKCVSLCVSLFLCLYLCHPVCLSVSPCLSLSLYLLVSLSQCKCKRTTEDYRGLQSTTEDYRGLKQTEAEPGPRLKDTETEKDTSRQYGRQTKRQERN